jgi:hypothetical protein
MDTVSRLITLLQDLPRQDWETTLRREFGGRHVYFSAATGRHRIVELRRLGVAERTARFKVRGT